MCLPILINVDVAGFLLVALLSKVLSVIVAALSGSISCKFSIACALSTGLFFAFSLAMYSSSLSATGCM